MLVFFLTSQICSAQCIDTLAKICRVVSLANLHMCFPRSNYWRRSSSVAPSTASLYVEAYFGLIFVPMTHTHTHTHNVNNKQIKQAQSITFFQL